MTSSNLTDGDIQSFGQSLSGMSDNVTRPSGPTGLVDTAIVNLVSTISYTYIMPVFFVFGTIGNVLSLIVLCADKKRNTTTMILIALGVSDLGYIATTFTRLISFIIQFFDVTLARNYRVVTLPHMRYVGFWFSRVTNLIITLISTERFIAVLFPLKVNLIFTQRLVLIILVTIYVGTFTFVFPAIFAGAFKWVVNPRTNRSTAVYYRTKLFMENREFWSIYADVVLNILLRFVPCVIVGLNTAAIIIKLKRVKAWRQDMSKSTNQKSAPRDDKLTVMLVTICGIFAVCSVPGFIFNVFRIVSSEFSLFGNYRNMFNLLTVLSSIFGYFNSCINFVVYITLNRRFAKTFKQIFGCGPEDSHTV